MCGFEVQNKTINQGFITTQIKKEKTHTIGFNKKERKKKKGRKEKERPRDWNGPGLFDTLQGSHYG